MVSFGPRKLSWDWDIYWAWHGPAWSKVMHGSGVFVDFLPNYKAERLASRFNVSGPSKPILRTCALTS